MQNLMRLTRKTTLIVALGATVGLATGPAIALADSADADRTAAVVAAAVDATPAASHEPAPIVASASPSQVIVPADPQQGVVLGGADGGPSLTLGLPASSLTSDATVVSNTTVYTQPGQENSIAVQPLSDGSLRTAVSIADANAPKDYSYTLTLPAGVSPVLNDAGGVDLVRTILADDEVSHIVVGGLERPWATDANGEPVATRYTVDGNTVTQHVEFSSDSAFPIVADPHIKWHWYGPGLMFNRTETGRIRNRAAAAALFAAICAFTGPETLGITCGVGGAELGAAAAVASNAYSDHKCLELLWGFVPRSRGC